MQWLTKGYQENPEELLQSAMFDVDYDEMVIIKDIEMFSLCEQHMLPFCGKVHLAYIPDGKVIGLSKVPQLVDVFARRLPLHERLTTETAKAVKRAIKPRGVAVVIEARHFCMMMRGVEKAAFRHDDVVNAGCFPRENDARRVSRASPGTRGTLIRLERRPFAPSSH